MSPFNCPAVALLATALFLFAAPLPAATQDNARVEPWSERTVELAESLPIQDGGRVKPLHTFAGFTMLRLHGKRSLVTPHGERLAPIEWLLDTLFFPEAASEYAIFLVHNAEVVEAIGIPQGDKRKRDRYSFNELRSGVAQLFQLAREYARIEERDRSFVQQQVYLLAGNVDTYMQLVSYMDFARTRIPAGAGEAVAGIFDGRAEVAFSEIAAAAPRLREIYRQRIDAHASGDDDELLAVANLLQAATDLVNGTESMALVPPDVPRADDELWKTPAGILLGALGGETAAAAQGPVLARFERLAAARNDSAAFERELAGLHTELVGRAQSRGEYDKVGLELTYYKSKAISRSLYAFILAFIGAAFMWLRPKNRVLYAGTSGLVLVATLLLAAAIAMRCVIRGRPPVSTLYETVLFVTAVGVMVGMFLELVTKERLAISAAALLGTVGLFIANGYEMLDKRDTMPSLVAVLDTNFWLATHVTSITIGYSAGMLAALLGSVYLVAKAVGWRRGDPATYKSLGRMVYGVICFGLIFSLVGTILGGIWANDSWGRFWGWDPKENGALLICISQILILHGRMGGYLRDHGTCMAAAFGGTIVAFSWWGVNLLGVGLHSYGFTSGISKALWTYYWIQWGIVGLGGLTIFLERRRQALLLRGASATLDNETGGVTA